MRKLLHVSASPRGPRSESLAIAETFLDAFRETHPDVEVERNGVAGRYRARSLSPEEATPVWPALLAMYPPYESYQKRTARVIPVVELKPIGG